MIDAELQKQLAPKIEKMSRELKCLSLKLRHLQSDIKALGDNPSKGAIEIVCEKYERPTNQKENICQYH